MFEDSLIESGGKLKTKRGATTVISFVIIGASIAAIIVINKRRGVRAGSH